MLSPESWYSRTLHHRQYPKGFYLTPLFATYLVNLDEGKSQANIGVIYASALLPLSVTFVLSFVPDSKGRTRSARGYGPTTPTSATWVVTLEVPPRLSLPMSPQVPPRSTPH